MEIVELRPAFVYDCENCSRENFVNAVVWEADEESEREMKEEFGVEEWETGEFLTIPNEVRCKFCGETFGTIDYRANDDENP